MKKIIAALLLTIGCLCASAQTPKAVIKSVQSGEGYQKANEKYERALEKNAADSPCMIVARAVLWDCWASWCDYYKGYKDDKYFETRYTLDAYYLLCDSRDEIISDENVEKMLKGLKTSYTAIFQGIERSSAEDLMEIDSESRYDEYLRYASAHSHPMTDTLMLMREQRAYADVCSQGSEDGYRRYLSKYGDGSKERLSDIEVRLRELLFNEALSGSDKEKVISFIQTYPLYDRTEELYPHLRRLQWPSYIEKDAALYLANGAVKSLTYNNFRVEFDRSGNEIVPEGSEEEPDGSLSTGEGRLPHFTITSRDIYGNWTERRDEDGSVDVRSIEYYF